MPITSKVNMERTFVIMIMIIYFNTKNDATVVALHPEPMRAQIHEYTTIYTEFLLLSIIE